MKKILVFFFVVFGFAAECGVFSNVLQTRNDNSYIQANGEVYVYDDDNNSLNTTSIIDNINSGRFIFFKDIDKYAQASGNTGNSLNIDYNFDIDKFIASPLDEVSETQCEDSVFSSCDDLTISSDTTVLNSKFNVIKVTTSNINVEFKRDLEDNKLELTSGNNIVFDDYHSVNIGDLIVNWNGADNSVKGENLDDVKIKNIILKNNTDIELSTNSYDDIHIENINLTYSSTITFSAYNIILNSVQLTENCETNLTAKNQILFGDFSQNYNDKTSFTADVIEGKNFISNEQTDLNMDATTHIYLENMQIGHSSTVVLKSPVININSFTVGNGNPAEVYIYANEVNISNFDLREGAKVYFFPYDPGKKIEFYSDETNQSSSSSMVLSSGDYHFGQLNLHSSSDVVPLIALDKDQEVNIYINHDLSTQNNPAINAPSKSDFGENPPSNFKMFINGDFYIGNGGTVINALVYTEGNIQIGTDTKIRGAMSAADKIVVYNDTDLYWSGDIADDEYGACPLPAKDLCYENMTTEGWGIDLGFISGGVEQKLIVPIKNISGQKLDEVSIALIKNDFVSGSLMDDCGIDDVSQKGKECNETNDLSILFANFNTSLFGTDNGVFYFIPVYDENVTHSIYDKKLADFELFKDMHLYVKYKKDGRWYEGELKKCVNENNSYAMGPFDAWDVDHNIIDRNITTKIVNEEFNLTIASVNKDNNATEKKENIDVRYALWNNDANSAITSWREFNATNEATKIDTFTVSSAERNLSVMFKVCADYNGSDYFLYPYSRCGNDCSSNGQVTHDSPCYRYFKSSDNFAVRPYAFLVFGENQYKRAGEDFNVTIVAVDKNTYEDAIKNNRNLSEIRGVRGYNVSISDLNISPKHYVPTDAEIRQMNQDVYGIDDNNASRVAYCPDNGFFSVVSGGSFDNGEINVTLEYNETGILDLNVSEIKGKEFALVDKDDTGDEVRMIKPAEDIRDSNDSNKTDLLMFIPYKFVTLGEYTTTTDTNWTYISNDVNTSYYDNSTPLMAGVIKYTVIAENRAGNKLTNYTKTCFPDVSTNAPKRNDLKLNTTFDLFLDAWINSDVNAVLFIYAQGEDLVTMWVPNHEVSIVKGDNHIKASISQLEFEKGTGKANMYINIQKIYNKPQVPAHIKVNEINTSTSWINSSKGATKIFVPADINKTIEYRYGSIFLQDESVYGTDANISVEYRYYTTDGWKLNIEHNSDVFGKIYVDKTNGLLSDLNISVTLSPVKDIKKGEELLGASTTHKLPYNAKIHFFIDPWMWYHPLAKPYKDPSLTDLDCLKHPCVNVTYLPSGKGWAGVGSGNSNYTEQNVTVNPDISMENNVSKQGVKKLNW